MSSNSKPTPRSVLVKSRKLFLLTISLAVLVAVVTYIRHRNNTSPEQTTQGASATAQATNPSTATMPDSASSGRAKGIAEKPTATDVQKRVVAKRLRPQLSASQRKALARLLPEFKQSTQPAAQTATATDLKPDAESEKRADATSAEPVAPTRDIARNWARQVPLPLPSAANAQGVKEAEKTEGIDGVATPATPSKPGITL